MKKLKSKSLKLSRQLHKSLVYLSFVALVLFLLSALSHPIMVWTGPQAQKFFPPSMVLEEKTVPQLLSVLQGINPEKIAIAKVVPAEFGPLLQVTENNQSPRRYYSLHDNTALPDQDQQQAVWLARYYTGQDAAVKQIEFVNEFSREYPWVNRLLPVYKVEFETDDRLTVFVHTETNALASINNDYKKSLQSIFQWLHTWSWLDGYPLLRVGIVAAMLLSLILVSSSGFAMLLLVKRRRYSSNVQFMHRKIAWLAVLPFIGLLMSGLYHLLQSEYGDVTAGLRLSESLNDEIPMQGQVLSSHALKSLEDLKLNSLSMFPYQNRLLLRASLATSQQSSSRQPHSHHIARDVKKRNKRFDGQASERGALYFDVMSGEAAPLTDIAVVKQAAMSFLNLNDDSDLSLSLVTHFGPNYDFRNKRLPVWQVDVENDRGDRVFIDPITGVLVEHLQVEQQLERLSFSVLHKWNILVPLFGREGRDVIVVVFLSAVLVLGALGLRMKLVGLKIIGTRNSVTKDQAVELK